MGRGLSDTVLNKLQVNQNNIIRVFLNKYSLQDSTTKNYRELDILSIKLIFKKMPFCSLLRRSYKVKIMKCWEIKEKIYYIITYTCQIFL